MSYSFTVKAKTKAEAKEKVIQEFQAVAKGQPVHLVDFDAVVASASAFVDMVADPEAENEEIQVSVNGSLTWKSEGVFTAAEVTIRAYMRSTL